MTSTGEVLSAISAISAGRLVSHATSFSTKEYYCPTEIKEIFFPLGAAISAISAISVGLLLYHAAGFSTKEYFCPTERTERTEIFTPHCGAFLSFLSFLWDDYYLMRKVFLSHGNKGNKGNPLTSCEPLSAISDLSAGRLLPHADSILLSHSHRLCRFARRSHRLCRFARRRNEGNKGNSSFGCCLRSAFGLKTSGSGTSES